MRAYTSQDGQVWVPNHVAAIVSHARWDRKKKEGGGGRAWRVELQDLAWPCPEWVVRLVCVWEKEKWVGLFGNKIT